MTVNGGKYLLFPPHLRMLQLSGHGHGENQVNSLHGCACEADHTVTFGDTSSAVNGLEKIGAVSAECTVGALPEITKKATSRNVPPHQVRDSLDYSCQCCKLLVCLHPVSDLRPNQQRSRAYLPSCECSHRETGISGTTKIQLKRIQRTRSWQTAPSMSRVPSTQRQLSRRLTGTSCHCFSAWHCSAA